MIKVLEEQRNTSPFSITNRLLLIFYQGRLSSLNKYIQKRRIKIWIETPNGIIVNLDQCVSIEVATNKAVGKSALVITSPAGQIVIAESEEEKDMRAVKARIREGLISGEYMIVISPLLFSKKGG